MNKNNSPLGIAACLFPLGQDSQDNAIQLFPAGKFTAPDGALTGEGPWHLDATLASAVIAALTTNDNILIDYDHQSLLFTKNKKPLEAAGTFAGSELEWRESIGLFATNVAWAAAAKKHFAKGEFLYISPLFTYHKSTGAVNQLISVAVTDSPAIKNMQAIELAAASFLPQTHPEEDTMNKELLALLKLSDNATDEEVLAACKTMQLAAASVEPLTDEIAALKANDSANPDPAKFVPVETMTALQNQVAALSNQVNDKQCGDLITAALNDGRLLEAQKGWAESLEIAALNAYLKEAQPIAALQGTQTGGKDPEVTDENGLTADEVTICAATGIDVEDYKKANGKD
ncbi:MAG: hypothetical protein GQ532_14990 [Methylomarinum sp.]|nr:hypothetical protein [Methylomarinum sp.]